MGSYTQLSFTEQVKRCSWCGETKPLTEFYVRKCDGGRHTAHCKACGRAATKAWKERDPEGIAARRRTRRTERRDEINALKRAWYHQNAETLRQRDRARYPLRAEAMKARANAWYHANKDRARSTRSAYYTAHREQISEHARRYRQENKDVIRERKRIAYYRDKPKYAARLEAYMEANRERARKRVREYAKAYPERVRYHHYARKARKGGPADAETVAFSKMLRRDTCSYCGGPAGTLDHVVPLAKGGTHHWSNLAAACLSCNNRKKTMSALTFLYRTNRRSEG